MRALSFFLILFFCNCQNNTNQLSINNESTIVFDLQKDFEITSSQKVIDKIHPKEGQLACKEWNLKKQDLAKIMQSMKSIRGEEWHHLFDHLACEINGKLIQDNNTFNYSINSGSWISVYTKDTTIWFGDIEKINEAIFMSSVLDRENKK